MIRTIEPMDVIPRGYGVVCRRPNSFLIEVAPIPINLVLGAIHSAWGWLLSAPAAWESPRHRIMRKAWRRGYLKGQAAGRAAGFREWTAMSNRQVIEANARTEAAMQAFDRFADRLTGRER